MAIALCTHYRELTATVADLPNITSVARHFVDEKGLSERITVLPCDMSTTTPKGHYDTAILRAVIQTLPRDKARQLLRNIGKSIILGGRILIFGSVLNNSRSGPASSLAYSLVFLNTYEEGQAYTEAEYREMLLESGFDSISVRFELLDDGMSLVSAVKK